MHSNNISVALANNGFGLGSNSLFCNIVGKEVLTFIKDRSVPGIKVLRSVFYLFSNSSTKSNGSSLLIMNRKHHSIIEPVADATVTLDSKVCSNHLLRGIATFTQVRYKRASARCISQLPALTDSRSKTATREICTRRLRTFSPSAHKHGVEVILGLGKALN